MRIRRRAGGRWLPAAALVPLLLTGLATVAPPALAATPGTITTWAGGAGEGPALNLTVRPGQLAVRGPIVYVADDEYRVIRALDTRTGQLRTVAGNGDPWSWAAQTPRADGGPAVAARLADPSGVAVDAAGRVYLSDRWDVRVRRVDVAGIISTFAGGGYQAERVGLPATQASLDPSDLAVDSAGNTFIVSGDRVHRVDTSGVISKIAGTYCGCLDPPQEDIPAIEASIHPLAVAVNASGQVHIANGGLVLRIDDAGMLRRVAGGGSPPDGLGDGGAAASARLSLPDALSFDAAGNLYIADRAGHRVRKVDIAGIITTVAGGGAPADGLGDGGPATSASLQEPAGVVVGPEGAIYVSDTLHGRVRRVHDGIITTVAGKARTGGGGDGGPVALAQFGLPTGMVRDAAGNTYVADTNADRVRKIDPAGRVSTIAGTGQVGPLGDGGAATSASLQDPRSVAVDGTGNVFIADTSNGRIRKVDTAGLISTIAGGGTRAPVEGAPATAALLEDLWGLAVDRAGNVYFGDADHRLIRRVTPQGTLSTFAGGGTAADRGEGGPATSATLTMYTGATLAFDAFGQLHISDAAGERVHKVDLNGIITTVVGAQGAIATPVEGRKATEVRMTDAGGIAFDANGALHVVDGRMGRVWRVDLMGRLRLVGGKTDQYGALGDGGPASQARIRINAASGLAFDAAGNLYMADTGTDRIRRIDTPTIPSRVFATGWNGVGQLGDGTLQDRTTFGATAGISNVRSVAAGYHHSLAVRADGGLSAWGSNSYGQLGDGTTTDRSRPTSAPGLSDVIAVAGGAYHSLALRTDGTVWAWGWNGVGQVGDGTTVDRLRPAQVPGLRNVKAIATGGFHSLALTTNGDVWAWGWNYYGAVGTGTASQVETRPVLVPGMSGATSIAGGALHSLASRRVGGVDEVWSWGWNGFGQLGDGTTIERRLPVRTGVFASRVTAGGYHSFADTDGPTYAWGWNAVGQLGVRSTEAVVASPAAVVVPLSGAIAAGLVHNVALTNDGSVITWGWNPYGAVGDGTLTTRTAPAVLPGGPGAGAVAAGVLHSIIVR